MTNDDAYEEFADRIEAIASAITATVEDLRAAVTEFVEQNVKPTSPAP